MGTSGRNNQRTNMPLYEVAVIVRNGLNRPELKESLKRICGILHSKGGVIHSMENLGEKPLPVHMNKNLQRYYYGNYFFVKANLPTYEIEALNRLYRKDDDVLKALIFEEKPEPPRPCQFKQCVFGEIVKPAYDRSAFKTNTLRHLKNKNVRK